PPAALGPEDAGAILEIFTEGYVMHQYSEWLLGTIGGLLDDDLSIGSAGLLKGGAVAWVSVEVPETVTTPGRRGLPAKPARLHLPRRLPRHHLPARRHQRRLRQHH